MRLRAAVAWEYATVKILEDPTPQEVLAARAGPLNLSFDTAEFADVKARKTIFAVGTGLARTRGADGRKQYAVGDVPLVNSREFLLRVVIRLRSQFKPAMLDNPAFVKQSNDPRDWSQTFEAEILEARAVN